MFIINNTFEVFTATNFMPLRLFVVSPFRQGDKLLGYYSIAYKRHSDDLKIRWCERITELAPFPWQFFLFKNFSLLQNIVSFTSYTPKRKCVFSFDVGRVRKVRIQVYTWQKFFRCCLVIFTLVWKVFPEGESYLLNVVYQRFVNIKY